MTVTPVNNQNSYLLTKLHALCNLRAGGAGPVVQAMAGPILETF